MRAFLDRMRPYAPLVLRLVVGVLAIGFAMTRVFHGMGDYQKQVLAWGLPPWVAPATAWGALVSGFLLVLGLATRLAGLVFLTVTVLIAVKTGVHTFFGGADFPLLTVAACASLVLSGAGRPSLDARFFG